MRVLGIEGTAWCASAALYDAETDSVLIESDPYEPDSGGIHPREAAEHMSEAIPEVVDRVLTAAEAEHGPDAIDAVAFSRGPGLGPCLRIVGTAARSLAGTLDVPLVGVNHMVAHLEIGRHQSGFDNPVCLNASGANAHLLGYHDGRYRVLGETMDAGVGNAIDKFTRHVGWSHPGGPKVEAAATEYAADGDDVAADLLDLPYVVKGMDFSFSGISSAANDAADDGVAVERICFSLQEHVFAMLAEVSERALSLTGADELVLGGGVAQNDRLREMLAAMCEARGAEFFAPKPRFLRDNAGMIAVLGAKMAAAGDTVPIAESAVDPNFRPDQVPVTWRTGESVARVPGSGGEAAGAETTGGETTDGEPADRRGAEATVAVTGTGDNRRVTKRRVAKSYRHPELDRTLRRDRTVAEARLASEARRAGVPTPLVYDIDLATATLTLQYVGDRDLAAALDERWTETVGRHLARLHRAGMVHGDPTTRNVRVSPDTAESAGRGGESNETSGTYLIDFGLGYHTGHVEDHAMDLHVFEGSVRATAADPDPLTAAFEAGYESAGDPEVLDRLRDVADRGRYR
ncbi:TsaD/Kae1/Qri7 protein, required for threonylcarbamoyladenosine t(6)A37 formation in tRNA / p53-regulating protein kinase (human PRPK/yeast YGR262c) [Halorubrum sp. DM2]|uniref:bifunctional N(6)-L-threonylcarbamoyladenine synthase/serine/threonine protein kinase n=1 Tax=Halorubrum sp. DM2 TaxID=2527867 RepID=UPI0024B6A1C5|nr:bifunctional N(6)-L-threonylcarbamoyladenine synthase/serine/threonine protein kinase [Halorubrum sp. DM2]VTT86432.1 TsaD/Kae1/Qri7 protein, required for threonylcarbamoyladenosine t(6)A37 formation in tRNA / p53-regulating protein kinase (human PRPK/yeast YGR262c) [Halorubrum sp. DM2]